MFMVRIVKHGILPLNSWEWNYKTSHPYCPEAQKILQSAVVVEALPSCGEESPARGCFHILWQGHIHTAFYHPRLRVCAVHASCIWCRLSALPSGKNFISCPRVPNMWLRIEEHLSRIEILYSGNRFLKHFLEKSIPPTKAPDFASLRIQGWLSIGGCALVKEKVESRGFFSFARTQTRP